MKRFGIYIMTMVVLAALSGCNLFPASPSAYTLTYRADTDTLEVMFAHHMDDFSGQLDARERPYFRNVRDIGSPRVGSLIPRNGSFAAYYPEGGVEVDPRSETYYEDIVRTMRFEAIASNGDILEASCELVQSRASTAKCTIRDAGVSILNRIYDGQSITIKPLDDMRFVFLTHVISIECGNTIITDRWAQLFGYDPYQRVLCSRADPSCAVYQVWDSYDQSHYEDCSGVRISGSDVIDGDVFQSYGDEVRQVKDFVFTPELSLSSLRAALPPPPVEKEPVPDDDADDDGVVDTEDPCPELAGLCDDDDVVEEEPAAAEPDIVVVSTPIFPENPLEETGREIQLDFDSDGVPDDFDLCPDLPDPLQLDHDNDWVGDACDLHDDITATLSTVDDRHEIDLHQDVDLDIRDHDDATTNPDGGANTGGDCTLTHGTRHNGVGLVLITCSLILLGLKRVRSTLLCAVIFGIVGCGNPFPHNADDYTMTYDVGEETDQLLVDFTFVVPEDYTFFSTTYDFGGFGELIDVWAEPVEDAENWTPETNTTVYTTSCTILSEEEHEGQCVVEFPAGFFPKCEPTLIFIRAQQHTTETTSATETEAETSENVSTAAYSPLLDVSTAEPVDGETITCDSPEGDPDPVVDDPDGDEVLGAADNCPEILNPLQEDVDEDGIGDACDEENGGLRTFLDETRQLNESGSDLNAEGGSCSLSGAKPNPSGIVLLLFGGVVLFLRRRKRLPLVLLLLATSFVIGCEVDDLFPPAVDAYTISEEGGDIKITFDGNRYALKSLNCHAGINTDVTCEHNQNGYHFEIGTECRQVQWKFCISETRYVGTDVCNSNDIAVTCEVTDYAAETVECSVDKNQFNNRYPESAGRDTFAIEWDQPACDHGRDGSDRIAWYSPMLNLRETTSSFGGILEDGLTEEELELLRLIHPGSIGANSDDEEEDTPAEPPAPAPAPDLDDDEPVVVSPPDEDDVVDDSYDSDDDGVPDRLDAYVDQEELWDGSRPLDGIEDGRYTGPALANTASSAGLMDTSDPDGDPDNDHFITRIDACPALAGDVDGCPDGEDDEESTGGFGGVGGYGAGVPGTNDGTPETGSGCQLAVSSGTLHSGAMLTIFFNLLTLFAFRRKYLK